MKKAYTLSEVLVVLAVLGLIAAFIIPAVLKTAPDRAALLYKKTFFATQEAAKKLIADNSLYYEIEGDAEHQGLFTDKTGSTNFCYNFAQKMNVTGIIDCNIEGTADSPNFTTTNGVAWYKFSGEFDDAGYKDVQVKCNSCEYKIRIYKDGRVGTDKDWTVAPDNCEKSENQILEKPFSYRKGS